MGSDLLIFPKKALVAIGIIILAVITAQGQIRTVAASPASTNSFMQQGFEEKRFPPAGWALEFTGDQHWSRYQGASGYGKGSGSALYNNVLIPAGTVQSLILASMGRSVAGDSLRFDHAYTTYSGEVDRLFIDVSNDGGAIWTNLVILDGGQYGPLATAPPQQTIFVPSSTQWATKSYSLPPGTDRVRFKALSNYGNNLYLDNIAIGHRLAADVAVRSIEVPGGVPTFSRIPGVTLGNNGTSPATVNVTLMISRGGYTAVRHVGGLAAGKDSTVMFDAWIPAAGQNTLTAYADLPDDGDRSNDTLRATVVGTVPTIVSGIDAMYRSGQAFVTWDNLATLGVRYTLYRSSSPITSGVQLVQAQNLGNVRDNSALNVRLTALSSGISKYLKIDSASTPLAATRGLFVATSTGQGTFYYAVTATVAGIEDTAIVAGSNATKTPLAESVVMPEPVWQESRSFGSQWADVYVQYATRVTSPSYPRMTNAGSYPFNFALIRSGSGSSHPVTFCMHPSESNFLDARLLMSVGDPNAWIVTIDDWIPNPDMQTFYYGYHEDYDIYSGNNPVPDNGVLHGYTAARVAQTVEWVIRRLPVDSTRTYMSGCSMGAIGSLLNGYVIPSRIAAILCFTPRLNNTTWDWQRMWGSSAADFLTDEGIPKSERLNVTSLARRQRSGSLPVTYMFVGKQDINVGWAEKIPFIDSMNAYRHGTFIFWGNTNHNQTYLASQWAPGFPNFSFFTRYRTNLSYPAFSNCSLNDNPGNGDPADGVSIGTINGLLDWSDQILDTTDRWEATLMTRSLANADGTIAAPEFGTTDVTLRRVQKFAPPMGSMLVWKNIKDSVFIEEEKVFKDSVVIQADSTKYNGDLITIPAFQVYKTSSRLVVEWHLTTGVDKGYTLPSRCLLEQNYPNPFNPSTTIRYGLPTRSHVSLTVFNTLGQQVAVLQNGEQEAGYHEVKFDGSKLASGVYLYRMQVRPSDSVLGRDSKDGAGSYTETKKFLLVR